MAFRLLRICNSFVYHHSPPGLATGLYNCLQQNVTIYKQQDILINFVRHTSFFNRYSADQLWKGATHVRNAGRKRGRLKSRRTIKNLNRGQYIGVGKINMVWPGLNAPVLSGREIVRQTNLPEDTEREKKIYKARDSFIKGKYAKLHPLDRGWTGGKVGGRKIGPPDPIGDETFDGFETIILEFKQVLRMTGNFGRKRRVSAFVITGNGQGLGGFGLGKLAEGRSALRVAKNRAGQRLMFVKRFEEHTVYHDFFCQFGHSKIYVTKKGEGYGLRCQRVLKSICQVLGIKNLHCKVEGPSCPQSLAKAFFLGLLRQKTHEELAEEKKLHLVEFRAERDNLPKVVASPTEVRKAEDIALGEVLDFRQYCMGGKIALEKVKYPPFFTKLPSWLTRQRKIAYLRNKDDVRIRMFAEHGELRSFLTDKYAEAKPFLWDKRKMMLKKKQQETEES